MNHLSPLQVPPVRAADRVPKPAPAAVPRATENLSVEDARALSIAAVNALGKENPGLLTRLIVDAGRRARNELPSTSRTLTGRAFWLVSEKMRRQLNDEEADFLRVYLESVSAP